MICSGFCIWIPDPGQFVQLGRRITPPTGCYHYCISAHLVIDEDEDDVRLLPLGSRPVVGGVWLTQVVFGLLSRNQVQAEEKAPQNHGGRRPHGGTLKRSANHSSWTPAGRKMSRVGTNAGRRLITQEQRGIRNPSRSCQLGSSCVLEHVRLQQRRSQRLCLNLLQPRQLRRASEQNLCPVGRPHVRGPQSCCWVSVLHNSGFQARLSLLRRKLELHYATAAFFPG